MGVRESYQKEANPGILAVIDQRYKYRKLTEVNDSKLQVDEN